MLTPASVTPDPSPTQPAAASIELRALGFTIYDADGEAIASHEFADDPEPAIEALTEAFAADPVLSEVEADPELCSPEALRAAWGGVELDHGLDIEKLLPPGQKFGLFVGVDEVNGVSIASPAGFVPGGTVPAGSEPLAKTLEYEGITYSWFAYDVAVGEDLGPAAHNEFWGAAAYVVDDVIESLFSPRRFYDGEDC